MTFSVSKLEYGDRVKEIPGKLYSLASLLTFHSCCIMQRYSCLMNVCRSGFSYTESRFSLNKSYVKLTSFLRFTVYDYAKVISLHK